MSQNEWYNAVDYIRPYVARIFTPRGNGTGFLLAKSTDGGICGVATAAHVISYAHWRELPVRIQHSQSGKVSLLRQSDRAVFIDETRDNAAIIFVRGDFPFPDDLLAITPRDVFLRTGNEIGWVGFPALSPDALCFFAGRVSSYREELDSYLVDGVAINGVSGGPAFTPEADGSVTVVGVVSAYIPNRATGESLPGLLEVSGVTKYHGVIQ